jgi:hypothetical protein
MLAILCWVQVAPAEAQEQPVPPASAASDSATLAAAVTTPPDTTRVVQRDIFDVINERIRHRKLEPELQGQMRYGVAWSVLPTLSYNPVYGLALGASLAGAGRLGNDPSSRVSQLSISGNYSTTGQLQLQIKGDIYTPSGTYLLRPDVRYLDTTRSTWGLGPVTADQQEYPMDFKMARFYVTALHRTGGSIYVGLGYHLDQYVDIRDDRAELAESTPYTEYSGATPSRARSSGVSVNLLSDTRDNLVNPMAGAYLSGSFRNYATALGSDQNWQEFIADVRVYPRLPRRSNNILAFWIYSWMTFGKPPYLNLPAIGWDTYGRGGRGYLQGRIRGPNQIYVETEYRVPLTRNGLLGAVGFLNLTTTTQPDESIFGRVDKGGGVGLRIKFNKRSNTNLALDRGWGEQGSGGWFLGTTEVF